MSNEGLSQGWRFQEEGGVSTGGLLRMELAPLDSHEETYILKTSKVPNLLFGLTISCLLSVQQR